MFKSLWSKLTDRKQAPRRRRLMPRVELLEDRCVPTYAIAEFPVLTASASPFGITNGPDGNIWFTENQADHIGMINPTTHAVSEFAIPTASSGPTGITAGPDGNVWFTEFAANQIGMISPTTHIVSQFAIPTSGSGPSAIAAGPDGNLWFTETSAGQIGEINPATHVVTEFALPTAGSGPLGITAGPDGNLWFTESTGNNVGSINPTLHTVHEYTVPQSGSQPYDIVGAANGNMYFTENAGNRIGELNLSTHAFSKTPVPTGSSGPYGITSGPDGNLYFVESSSDQIAQFNIAAGVIGEIAAPTAGAAPIGITAGAGGTLWFTESTGNQIGELVATPSITGNPVNAHIVAGQSATFTALATGFPTPAVQWQVSTDGGATFLPLINAGVYSGVTTGTLTITDAPQTMSGYQFDAVISNGVSPAPSVTTTPAALIINSALSITPALPQATVGGTYNQTLSVLGSTTPIDVLTVNNFSTGATGLSLSDITTNLINGTIAISGTPTAVGTATFTVTVANTGGSTLTQTLTITVNPALSIATASLPQATAGAVYNQAIAVVGGATPYTTFSVTNFSAGSTGLIAGDIAANAATGVFTIVGTPSAGGSATFTVNVADSAGAAVTKSFTLTVNPPLAITPTLPTGVSGSVYNQTLNVTGGGVPYSAITVNPFNAGATGLTLGNVTINAAAGTVKIDGTPAAAGTVTFTVNVVDTIGATLSKTFTVTINAGLSITPTLPAGTVGTSYLQTISVTGGITPYAAITPSPFSAGGTGLTAADITINPALGTIVISGTPTAVGIAGFSVTVVEPGGGGLTHAFTIAINAAPVLGGLTVSSWTAGLSGFTGSMTINGGTAPYSIASAGLPSGLTAAINGTTISFTGTPTAAGTYAQASITVHDAAGASVAKTFSMTINPAPSIGSLTTTQWTVGMAGFSGILPVSGGTGGLSIAGSNGLPAGMKLTLNAGALRVTGTPTTAGTFAGSVTLHDVLGAAVTQTFTITINAMPTLGSLTTTQWTAGKAGFTDAVAITGGTGPFVLAGLSGLPAGLTALVNGAAISITGTPTTAQTYGAGSITIHDAAGASVTEAFSITINPALQIATTSLTSSTMAILYTASLQFIGGTGAVTFAVTAGSLPPGMKLSKTGVISGVSRGIGSFTFTVTAIDSIGASVNEKLNLTLAL